MLPSFLRVRRIRSIALLVAICLLSAIDALAVTAAAPPPPGLGGAGLQQVIPAWRVAWTGVSPDIVRKQHGMHFSFRTIGIQGGGRVRLVIDDERSHIVATVEGDSAYIGPEGEMRWNTRDDSGVRVPNGVYMATLVAVDELGVSRATAQRPFRVERPVRARAVYRVDGTGPRVALTFDDCNFPDAWARILDILEARHADATFFCIGHNVQIFPALARRTYRAGHTIGNHSCSHPDLKSLSLAAVRYQLDCTTRSWWAPLRSTPVPYIRPPYGSFDAQVVAAAGALGYRDVVLWDVDPSDWTKPGPGVIASRVLANVRAGSIILLHVQDQTAQALPAILRGLRERRLKPVTLAELLASGDPVTVSSSGIAYSP